MRANEKALNMTPRGVRKSVRRSIEYSSLKEAGNPLVDIDESKLWN